MADPNVLLPLDDFPSRQDFKNLIMRRLEAVREKEISESPKVSEKDLFMDMLSKTQTLARSLQTQLDQEKRDHEQQLATIVKKYETDIAALKKQARGIGDCKDKNASEVREVLFSELRAREMQAARIVDQLGAETQTARAEADSLRLQLAAVQRELDVERQQRPKTSEQQMLVRQLESQVAALREQLQRPPPSLPLTQPSRTPSLPDFSVSEPATPKSDKGTAARLAFEQQIAQLVAEKQQAEHTIELMIKVSSEKEAELTEEAERLRVLNSSFLEFSNKSEEWVKAGFDGLTLQLETLCSAYEQVSPRLEGLVDNCAVLMRETQAQLAELSSAQVDEEGTLVEVLHALDTLQQHHSNSLQRCAPPQLEYPAELLAACAQLQKDLSAAHEQQLKDHQEFARNLSFVASSAAEREEELLESLRQHTLDLRSLREQLGDWQDLHLEDEIRMAKIANGRLLGEVDAAKRYILVLASCIKALQELVSELACDPSADTSRALRADIQRLQEENELLLARLRAETEAHNVQLSTLQEDASHAQSEIRQLRTKLDQLQQIQTLKAAEETNMWKEQVRAVTVANELLRRNCADLLAQSSRQRTSQFERAEVEGLKRLLELKTAELSGVRAVATTGFEAILAALQQVKDQLEAPSQVAQRLTAVDQAVVRITETAESMVVFSRDESERLREKCLEVADAMENFHKKLEDTASLAQHLFSACGLAPVNVKEKQYFAQSLEKLQTMHEAEVESFRQEVLQLDQQSSAERKRACEITKQLLDSMHYRQAVLDEMQQINSASQATEDPEENSALQKKLRALDAEIERHQQWELAIVDSLLRLLDRSSNAIEEANESSEVSSSDLSRIEAELLERGSL